MADRWTAKYMRYGTPGTYACGSLEEAASFLARGVEDGEHAADSILGPDGTVAWPDGSDEGIWELAERLHEEAEPVPLPVYAGTGPVDRVTKFLAAVAASQRDRGPSSPLEPAGLMGWRGEDGFYHELLEDDLRSLATGAREADD